MVQKAKSSGLVQVWWIRWLESFGLLGFLDFRNCRKLMKTEFLLGEQIFDTIPALLPLKKKAKLEEKNKR